MRRRLEEELGLTVPTRFLYRFEYSAPFLDIGTEWEVCSVFVGKTDTAPILNPREISELSYVEPQALDRQLAERSDDYTPWLKLEWHALRQDYWAQIEVL